MEPSPSKKPKLKETPEQDSSRSSLRTRRQEEAEARAEEAERREEEEAEAKAKITLQKAEARVEEAEARVKEAERREEEAERRQEEAEAKAKITLQKAEARAEEAERREEEAERREEEAEARAKITLQKAEARAKEAEARAEEAEAKAKITLQKAEARLQEAESRIQFLSIMLMTWSELKAHLEARYIVGAFGSCLFFSHEFSNEDSIEKLKNLIMEHILLTNIDEILQAVPSALSERDLQKSLDEIGTIIAKSFNKVADLNSKVIPYIAYVSETEIRKSTEGERKLYPDGSFYLEVDVKSSKPIEHSLVMIELKHHLPFSEQLPLRRPWNFDSMFNGKAIAESSTGHTALLQSFKRSLYYFRSTDNTDKMANSLLTDLNSVHFLQLKSAFCSGELPSWDKLEGSLTFPQNIREPPSVACQGGSSSGTRTIVENVDSSSMPQTDTLQSHQPESHTSYPGLETLVKLLLDLIWPKDIKGEAEVVDLYMKELEKIPLATHPLHAPRLTTNSTGVETLQLLKQDETIVILDSIGEFATGDRIIMAVRSGQVKQCLKMERSRLFHSMDGQLKNELKILSQLQHLKGFPKLLHRGTMNNYRNDSWVCMVTEPLGVAFDLLPHSLFFSSPSTTLTLWSLMRQILVNLHDHGFLHCDIKPSNMILSSNGPCLIDFGGAVPNPKLGRCNYDGFRFSTPWAPKDLIDGDRPSILSDHISLFFSFLDLISEGKLIDLGYESPEEIAQLVFSILPQGFHCWARHLLYVFGFCKDPIACTYKPGNEVPDNDFSPMTTDVTQAGTHSSDSSFSDTLSAGVCATHEEK